RAALRRIAMGADVPFRAGVAVVVVPAGEVTVRIHGAAEADQALGAGAASAADARSGAGERVGVAGAGGRRRAGADGARAGADAAGLGCGHRPCGERRATAVAGRAEERDALVGYHRR